MIKRSVITALAAVIVCGAAYADRVQQLVNDLQQADTPAQVDARVLLPREGIKAVPLLLPLLDNPDARISWSAKRVLEDLCNGLAAPGASEADRMAAANALPALLAADKPDFTRTSALDLIAIVAPEGFDMTPVANLIGDAQLDQRARYCLQLAATTEARAALRDALNNGDPAVVYGVLDSLEKLRDAESVPAIQALFTHNDPMVRSAALRAVSWTGDVSLVDPFKSVIASATDKSAFEAYDALLSLAEHIVLRGGNHQVAMNVYRDVLANAKSPVTQAGAMSGLGRYGDERNVPLLVQAATANPALEDALMPALEAVRGRAGAVAIAAVYPSLTPVTKQRALEMFARRQDEPLMAILLEEAKSTDAPVQETAQRGLISAGRIEAMPLLVEQAKGEGEPKAAALATMGKLAQSMGHKGNVTGAGQVYKTMLELAGDDETKQAALRGIAQYPVSGAFDLVKAAGAEPNLKADAVPALLAVARAFASEELGENAVEVLQFAMSLDPSPDMLQAITAQLQQHQSSAEAQAAMGFIRKWKVIGSFEWDSDEAWNTAFLGEPTLDFAKEVKAGDRVLEWKTVNAENSMAHVDLMGLVGQRDRAFAYAYAEVISPKAQPAQLRMGSDDGVRAWVNGEMVHDNNVDRGAALDQDVVDINLKEGVNTILLRISQGAGGWGYMARLSGTGGAPLEFTQE